MRLFASLAPKILGGLPQGLTTFSSQPGAFQKRLTVSPALLQRFAQDQEVWRGAFKDVEEFAMRPQKFSADPRTYAEKIDPNGVKVSLIISKGIRDGSAACTMRLVDGSGYESGYAEVRVAEPPAPAAQIGPSGELTLSPEATSYMKAVGMFGKLEQDPRWREAVLHPELHEPLSLGVSDLLFKVGDTCGENIVANLPDAAFELPGMVGDKIGKVKLDRFWRVLSFVNMSASADGNWRLFMREPGGCSCDRRPLGQLLRATADAGYMTLDDLADYAFQSGSDRLCELLEYLGNATVPDALSALQPSWPDVRLYGALNRTQRADLKAGKPLPLSETSLAFRDLLTSRVFGSARLNLIFAQPPRPPGFERRHRPAPEASDLLPNGLDTSGNLTMQYHSSRAASVRLYREEADYSYSRVMPMRMLARQSLASTMPQLDVFRGEQVQGYIPGSVGYIQLFCPLSPTVTLPINLQEPRFDMRAKPVPLQQLPADFLADLAKAVEEAKRNYANTPTPGTKSAPPPSSK